MTEPRFQLDNRTGYETSDLVRFVRAGFRACKVRKPKRVIFVASPVRTRGCAEVAKDRAGSAIVIALAAPSRFTLAKLARVFEHECEHAKGVEHEAMPPKLLYSLGDVPAWARGLRIRYRGRAENQMVRLRSGG